jgi:hypothetical protein
MSLFLALLAASAANPATAPICKDARPQHVQSAKEARPKRLGELPPAEAYLAVLRTENGCIRRVLVREERARGR